VSARAEGEGLCDGGEAPCRTEVPRGAMLTLEAVAEEGSRFDGWSGVDGCDAEASCEVMVTAELEIAAGFSLLVQRPLTVETAGMGLGTVTGEGIACGDDCMEAYDDGTVVTLTATAASGISTFAGWGGGGCSGSEATCEVTMDAAKTVTASFDLLPRMLVVAQDGSGEGVVRSDDGAIDCAPKCAASYGHGASVTLTAVADTATSRFAGWGAGPCEDVVEPVCIVTVTDGLKVTATLELLPRQLTVQLSGSGRGQVTGDVECEGPEPCTSDFEHGRRVVLRAEPELASSRLVRWVGCDELSGPECTVTMDRARAVTAQLVLLARQLTVRKAGNGAGRVSSAPAGIDRGNSCGAQLDSFSHGTTVTLEATANAATSQFIRWTGDCSGTASICTVEMDGAKTVNAEFRLLRRRLNVSVAGTGTVTSSPVGIDCPGDCLHSYDHGTTVTLDRQIPTWPLRFCRWEGAASGCGDARTCRITMTATRTVRAVFGTVFTPGCGI